jgi:alpha-tubulin suppressor-like RCC1 family protein
MMGNDVDEVLTPASPNVPGVGLRTIEAHTQHTCGITTSDELYCWGYNWIVALGSIDPSGTDEVIAPRQYSFGGSSKAKTVDTGALHTCAEDLSGTLWCWGNAFFAAIGDGGGQPLDYVPPKKVIGFSTGFIQVESGGMDENDSESGASFDNDFSCAIDSAGAAKCWGSDSSGELGNRAMANTDTGNAAESTPQQVYGLNKDVVDLALGGGHACAIQNSDLYCWGDNEYGQLGDGTNTDRNAPVKVDSSNIPGTKTPNDVEAGYYHTCVIYNDDSVACWGRNSKGQLGDGSTNNTNKPKMILQ